jgi:hypothetical protein
VYVAYIVFVHVVVYISTDVCKLILAVCCSSHILMLRKNTITFLVFFVFLFGFGSVMAQPSSISTADSRHHLDVYISKCYNFVS